MATAKYVDGFVIKEMCDASNSPFDFKRMAYGGFKVLVDA